MPSRAKQIRREVLLKFYAKTNYFETFMRRQIFPNTLMLEDSLIGNKF